MDRSHWGGVQCEGIITLACFIFELVPFVVFHTWILSGACPSFTTWGKTGVSCDNLPLLYAVENAVKFHKSINQFSASEGINPSPTAVKPCIWLTELQSLALTIVGLVFVDFLSENKILDLFTCNCSLDDLFGCERVWWRKNEGKSAFCHFSSRYCCSQSVVYLCVCVVQILQNHWHFVMYLCFYSRYQVETWNVIMFSKR